MPKITLIGAGSAVFTRNLCSDVLLAPVLRNSTISLMDIDAERLRTARDLVQDIVDRRGLDATVEATTDRREAVRGADYVVTTFQQGGLDAYAWTSRSRRSTTSSSASATLWDPVASFAP
jgi:alpha-galactosidase